MFVLYLHLWIVLEILIAHLLATGWLGWVGSLVELLDKSINWLGREKIFMELQKINGGKMT